MSRPQIRGRLAAMKPVAILLCGLAVLLSGCATTQRLGAAGDVHLLLLAIRDGDQAAFDAHIDRPALKAELESRILNRAGRTDGSGSLSALAAVLAGPIADAAADAVLHPQVFRSVAEYYGYRPDQPIPGPLVIASQLRSLPDGRVCATRRRDGPCLVTFARRDGAWRLVSFDGEASMLRLGR